MNNFQVLHYHFTLDLKDISFLEVGQINDLIPDEHNTARFRDAHEKEIKERLGTLIDLLKNKNEALIFFSSSFLDLLEKEKSSIYKAIQMFVQSGQIELVGSCAYNSLSYMFHPELFKKEVVFHKQTYRHHFEKEASVFINTAGLFDDNVISCLEGLGYEAVIAPANSWHLSSLKIAETYQSAGDRPLKVLLSNGDKSSSTYVGLSMGYGCDYRNNQIQHSALDNLGKMLKSKKKSDTYSVSLPLSSPEWVNPLSNYLSNPLQKALMNECTRLLDSHQDKLSDDEWKTIILICQPEQLLKLNSPLQTTSYQAFINSMNILTSIGLRYA